MAVAAGAIGAACLSPSSSVKVSVPDRMRCSGVALRRRGGFRAMAQQQTYQGASAAYAKEMERLSAKESLLLAFKDSGGFESLASGKTTELQRIDVNERIVALERLNPTPRPTTSPFLEGRWNFEWYSAGSPGLLAAKLIFERFPTAVANLTGLSILIKDNYSRVSANLKLLNSVIAGNFILTAKLSIEGPTRLKEEYLEGVLETPTVSDTSIPEQLRGPLGQAAGSLQQLPLPIRDALSSGLKIPLNGVYQRLFMISYLDEEILIVRDGSGSPDVLTRMEGPPDSSSDPLAEYDS
ncbi:putative plastid-lipid-associated protein 13, chloroplastic [Wolffia australiana]